jgi:hypothetical protein
MASAAFRNAVETPPPGWTGPVFQLSRDYPTRKPACDAPWLRRQVSFTDAGQSWSQWADYIKDIVDYVWEGQDPNIPNETGWKVEVNGRTRWFHVPWMAYSGHEGREFIHGLTNELSTSLSSFTGRGGGLHRLAVAPGKDDGPLFETWSVGMYNPCGAWSIGQAIGRDGRPAVVTDKGRTFARGLPFAPGTVVIKVLNTTATERDVAYLRGAPRWMANAHVQQPDGTYAQCARAPRPVHTVQIDIAVVDPRSPTRWVYATLAYDGRIEGPTVRSRMVPLGVQWGNDPLTFPAVPSNKSQPLRETVLNKIGIYEHYGCESRLAGAVDQSNSSCMSCHMGAFSAKVGTVGAQGTNIPNIFSYADMCTAFTPANRDYYTNYRYPQRYPGSKGLIAEAIPLDSSLQLQVAFTQYATALNPPVNPICPPAGN